MRKIVIDPRVIKHLGRDLITSPEEIGRAHV